MQKKKEWKENKICRIGKLITIIKLYIWKGDRNQYQQQHSCWKSNIQQQKQKQWHHNFFFLEIEEENCSVTPNNNNDNVKNKPFNWSKETMQKKTQKNKNLEKKQQQSTNKIFYSFSCFILKIYPSLTAHKKKKNLFYCQIFFFWLLFFKMITVNQQNKMRQKKKNLFFFFFCNQITFVGQKMRLLTVEIFGTNIICHGTAVASFIYCFRRSLVLSSSCRSLKRSLFFLLTFTDLSPITLNKLQLNIWTS